MDITVAGDVSFAGFTYYMKKIGNCTYKDPFVKIIDLIKSDFVVVNLESPFGDVEKPPAMLTKEKSIHMLAEPESIDGLR